jgi:hypothetical protein
MKAKRFVIIGVCGLWTILLGAYTPLAWAQNDEPPPAPEHHEHQTPAVEGAPMTEHHHDMENMAPVYYGGLYGPPAILPPDETRPTLS